MSKYTPGPWAINTAGSAKAGQPFKVTEIYVYAPDTQDDVAICADVIDPVTQAPSEANACLIAAAPDLLEALKNYHLPIDLDNLDLSRAEFGPESVRAELQRRAAIAKATREAL